MDFMERREKLMNGTKPKLWTTQFTLVICTTFLFLFCLHMLNASTPAYITNITHNPAIGGSMTTAFMIGSIFTRPFISSFLPKINMKKAIYFSLLLISLLILLSYYLISIPFYIFFRAAEGIGFGMITTILATIVAMTIPKERTGEGIGYFAMAMSLGASLAPVAALAIFHTFSYQWDLLSALFVILIISGCSLFIKNQMKVENKTSGNPGFFQYIFDQRALFPSFLIFLLCITFAGVFNFIDGLGNETGLGAKASWFFMMFMIMILFIRPISGVLFDRKGHKFLILPASIFGMLGLLLLSQANTLFLLFAAALFYGIGYGVMHPALQAWAVSQVEQHKKGTANAMVLTGMDLGMALGAPLLGSIAGHTDYKEMFGLSSMFLLFLLLIYIIKLVQTKDQTVIEKKESSTEIS
jgi:MFS family permease